MTDRQTDTAWASGYRAALFGSDDAAVVLATLSPELGQRRDGPRDRWRGLVYLVHRTLQMRPDPARRLPAEDWSLQHRTILDLLLRSPVSAERQLVLTLFSTLEDGPGPQSASPAFLEARRRYTDWLDVHGRTAEALAVHALTHGPSWAVADLPDLTIDALRIARLQRRLARWTEAATGYAEARRLARLRHDHDRMLDAELGLVKVLTGRGNLPEARARCAELRRAALRAGDRVRHRIALFNGVLAARGGQAADALARFLEAAALAPDHDDALLALGNAGMTLAARGHVETAETIHDCVRRAATSPDLRRKAEIELVRLRAHQSPGAFDVMAADLLDALPTMTPSQRTDCRAALAEGCARLGRQEQADDLLAAALAEAESCQLNEWTLRIEAMQRQPKPRPAAAPDPALAVPALLDGIGAFTGRLLAQAAAA